MTNQDWKEKLEAQFADMFNLVEVQVGVSERENLFNFIAQEIKTAEERERREVIEEIKKHATIVSPDMVFLIFIGFFLVIFLHSAPNKDGINFRVCLAKNPVAECQKLIPKK